MSYVKFPWSVFNGVYRSVEDTHDCLRKCHSLRNFCLRNTCIASNEYLSPRNKFPLLHTLYVSLFRRNLGINRLCGPTPSCKKLKSDLQTTLLCHFYLQFLASLDQASQHGKVHCSCRQSRRSRTLGQCLHLLE